MNLERLYDALSTRHKETGKAEFEFHGFHVRGASNHGTQVFTVIDTGEHYCISRMVAWYDRVLTDALGSAVRQHVEWIEPPTTLMATKLALYV